jgi:signal transduction histidine kinase
MAAALRGGEWDLIISDFSLPRFGALGALDLRRDLGADVPILIVSGTIEEEDAVECLRRGAEDFITKSRLARLGPAIERSLREAQERKARRTAEERLRQSQKMEAIGLLAGGVAHDFNNLLGVIQGYGELLQKDPGDEGTNRRRIDQILQATQRGGALTRQLLAFSRQQPIESRSLDLNEVVIGVETLLSRLIGEDIEVKTVLFKALHPVKADPAEIEQVLLNLAVNARDAMPGGGLLIIETSNVDLSEAYVLSHPDGRGGPHVLLTVSDTGHGMDAATVAHAFEPFFTTKESGKGTGLGLATVYGIARKAGGHVGVYSEPGRGTTFKVYLPRTERAVAAPERRSEREAAPTGSETVLLVEDEEALRTVIGELLEQGGYRVIEGPSPEAALEAAAKHEGPIHLVLTDLVMPRISGFEVVARLEKARPGVRVLFMSGYTSATAQSQASLPALRAFLQKPFSGEALLRSVREVLDSPA